ncbi:hypothetical protein ACHAWF_013500 [Thalassiosira exigua]
MSQRTGICCIPRSSSAGTDTSNTGSKVADNNSRRPCRCVRASVQHGANTEGPELSIATQSGPYGVHAIATRDIKAGSLIVQCLPLAHSVLVAPGLSIGESDANGDDSGKGGGPGICTLEVDSDLTNTDEARIHHGDVLVSCGPGPFSSLLASPEQHAPTSDSMAMSLAKDLMESHAVRGSSSKVENQESNGSEATSAALRIWGYGRDNNNICTTYQAIQRTLSAFKKNNFGIVNSLHSLIGEGVYPAAALLNHSCSPNCVLRYELGAADINGKKRQHPPVLQIIACKDIVSGEELCHSYVDLALCTRDRQACLSDTHGFICECIRCQNGGCVVELPKQKDEWRLWPLTNGFHMGERDNIQTGQTGAVDLEEAMSGYHGLTEAEMEIYHESRRLQEQASQCMLEDDTTGELLNLQKAIELYAPRGIKNQIWVSPFNNQLYSTRCSYFATLLASGDINQAVEQCEEMVSFLAVIHTNHPLLGLQLYTLGDLYSSAAIMNDDFLGKDEKLDFKEKSMLAYAWAEKVMTITHGANDPLAKTLGVNLATMR